MFQSASEDLLITRIKSEKNSIFQHRSVKGNKQCMAIYIYIAMLLKPPGAPLIVDSYKEVLHATALLLILQGSCQGCEHVLSPFQRALKSKNNPCWIWLCRLQKPKSKFGMNSCLLLCSFIFLSSFDELWRDSKELARKQPGHLTCESSWPWHESKARN